MVKFLKGMGIVELIVSIVIAIFLCAKMWDYDEALALETAIGLIIVSVVSFICCLAFANMYGNIESMYAMIYRMYHNEERKTESDTTYNFIGIKNEPESTKSKRGWICAHCDTQNSEHEQYCKNCGKYR
ncbi:MAG: hypothetical protein E7653_00480 [Ruminococcaceae bacterium]|nr:hypothetical protein [Oscillospiraceae bacterium]